MRTLFIVIFLLPAIHLFGQSDYPKGYFRNPLNIPINLSGNFGELRSNHYHMGLDLKTQQRENLPVHAAAEGYISRIKIEPGGFGRAIYISHPNGYTTVYAHLNNFASKIEAFVKEQQYALESWRVYLELTPDKFPLKKGEFIANSGNTGGSQAPHLHFEIRRTADDVNVNPLLFGFSIPDNVAPKILRLGIFDRTKSVYEQSPKIFPAKPVQGSKYTTTPTVIKVNSPLISFAITAYDTHTGSANLNGIFEASLEVNDIELESFRMDNISYNSTRYLNAHIDYSYKQKGGAYLQHLSELPGYINSIYTNGNGSGVVDISDGKVHKVAIEVVDAHGNTSWLNTKVQYDGKPVPHKKSGGKLFYPLMLDGHEAENCEFYIGEKCLYDSVHIRYANTASSNPDVVSDVHIIGDGYIPLQESFLVRIKPDVTYNEADSQRIVMLWTQGSKRAVQKVNWQQDWASAKFRDFGSFQLVRDTVSPTIIPVGFVDGANLSKASRIVFTVRDNLPGVKNVRAELDGKWLRFTNDKGRNFIYQFDEKCLSGSHVLEIFAEDEAGNTTSSKYRFTR